MMYCCRVGVLYEVRVEVFVEVGVRRLGISDISSSSKVK